MAEIFSLAEHKANLVPHSSGPAFCLDCAHKWEAVAPVGTEWLECPACSLVRGRFKFQFEREGLRWFCNCGNDLFYVGEDGTYCPNCGAAANP